MTQSQEVAIVVVPFPAQGHLNQLLHFSLNLLGSLGRGRNFSVHYVSSPTHIRQARHRIHGRDAESIKKLHFHDLPIPSFPVPPPDANSTFKFPSHLIPTFDASMHMQAPLAELLRSLSAASRRLVVVHDVLMSYAGHAVASVDNAESYAFHCTPAFYGLSLMWEEGERPATDLSREVLDVISTRLDGCYPGEFWEHVDRSTFDTPKQAGLLVNTCRAIEGEFLDLIAGGYVPDGERLFAVGPVNPVAAYERLGDKKRHKCLDWLDRQPTATVVFVSFGSTTTISDGQIEQLAIGLRRSGQRFIWVVRDADRGDIFVEGGRPRERRLPEGFEEEVEGRGIVVRGWAPQLDILSHPSRGAFVSHCGWNSCMESLSLGVPIIGWPMHSDQPRNAIMAESYLKVGVTVRDWDDRDRVVSAAEIEEAIEKVMVLDEGKEVRERAKALGEAIRLAVSDGGSSRTDMDLFIARITR
ncbi:cis-zeatin O-glucosyltransferase 2 [Iris pallida]|uniref:Glycosyltransferase n=1 Tax=Iris pallida TaxID=29817 RepID=A0AAX6H254_IRIPA|nr:cis-zeatin O-glucosyltransferase 2 [Iris pallida]